VEEINRKLDLIISILMIRNKEEIKKYVLGIISKTEEQLLYQESDGIKSTRKLEEITGISKSKVSECWDKWTNKKIMTKNKENRGLRLFDLDVLEIKYQE